MSDRIAFADESGTDNNSKCYAIGVLSVAKDSLPAFEAAFRESVRSHGVTGEVRCKNVDRSHGLMNFVLEWVHKVLNSRTARYDAIVVNTAQYRLWRERRANRELAFYKTYTYLLRHIVRELRLTTAVLIDDRSDAYGKHAEVVETIGNSMLAQLNASGRLSSVRKIPSHSCPGIQIADLITGAIAAGHRMRLDPSAPLNSGNRLVISRLADYLGWDALHYDTMPDSRFNIWHFPTEFRGEPATRSILRRQEPIFVTPADVLAAQQAACT